MKENPCHRVARCAENLSARKFCRALEYCRDFFRSVPATEGLVEQLWTFAKAGYLDSPLPSLLKERLFVHLSRFCEMRYCIVRHVGFLIGEGWTAGDKNAPHQSVEEVIRLLRRPIPSAQALGNSSGVWKLGVKLPNCRPRRARSRMTCSMR